LLETVREVNRRIAEADPDLLPANRTVEEISAERHGAIRLGRPDELRDMGRFFACLNMFPVNFYNLAEAGAKSQPVISTAFRPLQDADHRIFCSLLMPECFPPDVRKRVESALAERRIFTPELLGLMQKMEAEGAFGGIDTEAFIAEAKQLFGWRGEARDRALYRDLVGAKLNIAADIACFPNPHLNHLTPNSLDIDALYAEMSQRLKGPYAHLPHRGMKDSIEGPPRRNAPILLRQTAYNALDEAVRFVDASGDEANAVHRARFGEIEQRGVALTPKGRALYDEAIADPDPETAFARIPDSFEELRRDDLAYFRSSGNGHEPVRYEDFLPDQRRRHLRLQPRPVRHPHGRCPGGQFHSGSPRGIPRSPNRRRVRPVCGSRDQCPGHDTCLHCDGLPYNPPCPKHPAAHPIQDSDPIEQLTRYYGIGEHRFLLKTIK
jgi:uncharacterized glyoxalase superfamily metalloenzyme YdcJ